LEKRRLTTVGLVEIASGGGSVMNDPKAFDHLLKRAMLNWDITPDVDSPRPVRINTRQVGGTRVTDLLGAGIKARRGARHRALDDGDYVCLVCFFGGQAHIASNESERAFAAGDIGVWRNVGDAALDVGDWSDQLVVVMPEVQFKTYLKLPLLVNQWVATGVSTTGKLIGNFFETMRDNLSSMDGRSAEAALDMAMSLIGNAIDREQSQQDLRPRTSLYGRILAYIDRHLHEAFLTPKHLAEVHGISLRYLNLLFANNGETVAGRIRERRLLKCREELERRRNGVSITEMAYRWGFSDTSHFSRSFKQRFGTSPSSWQQEKAFG
jgi:AraC-like DNA-binding protein